MPDNDDAPKSAYELAMDRLRKKDADAGVEQRPLTDAQKAAIGEIRQLATAKLAELKILHQSSLMKIRDPDAYAQLEDDYRREVQRIEEDRERKIENVRRGES